VRADEPGRAESLYAGALETLREVKRLHPENIVYRLELANCLHEMGSLADARERLGEAEDLYVESLAELEKTLEATPGHPVLLGRIGIAEADLAATLHKSGQLDGALEHFELAAARQREALERSTKPTGAALELASALRGKARVLLDQGEWLAAAEVSETVSGLPNGSWEDSLRAAERLARCCEAVRAEDVRASDESDRDARTEELSRRACAQLRLAIERGMSPPADIRTAPLLAALGGTAAFDELLSEVP
jgi:tetratricopeptide (TPR) repeat protein